MNKATEEQLRDEIEQLNNEKRMWFWRASFWIGVANIAVDRGVRDRLVGPHSAALESVVYAYIEQALDDGEIVAADDGDANVEEEVFPWPVVDGILAEIGMEGDALLTEYIGTNQERLQRAVQLLGAQGLPDGTLFAGKPISREMAMEILHGEFSDEFHRQFSDKYIVHVMHGDKPCFHPFDTIDHAIESTARDLMDGTITDALLVTHGEKTVMDGPALADRIAQINNAGMN